MQGGRLLLALIVSELYADMLFYSHFPPTNVFSHRKRKSVDSKLLRMSHLRWKENIPTSCHFSVWHFFKTLWSLSSIVLPKNLNQSVKVDGNQSWNSIIFILCCRHRINAFSLCLHRKYINSTVVVVKIFQLQVLIMCLISSFWLKLNILWQIITLSDLDCDYLNPFECSRKLNKVCWCGLLLLFF